MIYGKKLGGSSPCARRMSHSFSTHKIIRLARERVARPEMIAKIEAAMIFKLRITSKKGPEDYSV